MPRPYTHSLLMVGVLAALGAASRRHHLRQVLFGVAFGVAAHLLRDLATGPGVAFLWPAVDAPIKVPYVFYATTLVAAMIASAPTALAVLPPAASPSFCSRSSPSWRWRLRAASAHRIALGTYIRGIEDSPSLLDRYAEDVGRRPAIVGAYKRWDVAPFYRPELAEIASRGRCR